MTSLEQGDTLAMPIASRSIGVGGGQERHHGTQKKNLKHKSSSPFGWTSSPVTLSNSQPQQPYHHGRHSLLQVVFISLLISCSLMIRNSLLLQVEANEHLPPPRPDRVLELTSDNYDQQTGKYQIVVLNFYADWCPYSARWKPVFGDAATTIYNETRDMDPSSIVFGQINCERETTLSQRFRITKFPTTKLTLNGKPCKKEYRGARTAAAFKEYVQKFLTDPIVLVTNHADLAGKVEERKGALVMYSGRPEELAAGAGPSASPELQMFRRVAQTLREDCQFLYVTSAASLGRVQAPDTFKIVFKPHHKKLGQEGELEFPSRTLTDSATLAVWAKEHCIPLVREITFENAEELTEEGLPFVILFYEPQDKSWIELYKRVVESELKQEATGVTFLYADGHVFSHPLKHLGKTTKDLPLVAIDSFKHLFLYKQPVASISQPGKLKQFIADLHSGKLDREFHFGPDPVEPGSEPAAPPESAFNKLQPSAYRYSLLTQHDEL